MFLETKSIAPPNVGMKLAYGECSWSRIGSSWSKLTGCPDPNNYYCSEPSNLVGRVDWEELDRRVENTVALEERHGCDSEDFKKEWDADPEKFWPLEAIRKCKKDGKDVYVPHIQIVGDTVYPSFFGVLEVRKTPCFPKAPSGEGKTKGS